MESVTITFEIDDETKCLLEAIKIIMRDSSLYDVTNDTTINEIIVYCMTEGINVFLDSMADPELMKKCQNEIRLGLEVDQILNTMD